MNSTRALSLSHIRQWALGSNRGKAGYLTKIKRWDMESGLLNPDIRKRLEVRLRGRYGNEKRDKAVGPPITQMSKPRTTPMRGKKSLG